MALKTIDEYLAAMRTSFLPERAAGRHAVLQYEFTGRETGVCHVVIAEGAIHTERGPHAHPDAIITSDFDTWMRVVSYQIDPLLAVQDGLYTARGDVILLMDSDTWFSHE